jgi:hypothetical protein
MLKKLDIPFIFSHHTVDDKLVVIGSILGIAGNWNSAIYGAGFMNSNDRPPSKDANYIAVRGPRTRNILKEHGIDVSNILLGDPGILLPYVYNPPKPEKKYKLGIIPHNVDHDEVSMLINTDPNNRGQMTDGTGPFKDTILINPQTSVSMIEPFIDKVLSCEKIISTCLHGTIAAHAYNIPVKWYRNSDRLCGDDVKFHDYFESQGISGLTPLQSITGTDMEIPPVDLKLDVESLWQARPFESLDDRFYVDIDSDTWIDEIYPPGYEADGGKVWDDRCWL